MYVSLSTIAPEPSSAKGNGPSETAATLVGSMSIFLWAVWPSLAVFAAPVPTFQILAIGLAVGFAVLAFLRLFRGEPVSGMFPKSWGLLIAGVIGILGTNVFNFLAITKIPPEQASVLAYTWPMIALFLAGALRLQSLGRRHVMAIALGFCGVVLVVNPFASISFDLVGIGLALMAGLSYAGYTVYRQVDARSASDAVGIYGLIAALVCAGLHFTFETTQSLTGTQMIAIIALGVAPMGLANAVWDYGVARGDARTMSILAYGTPLVATLLLSLLGLAELTVPLLFGAFLIIGGAALGTWPTRNR